MLNGTRQSKVADRRRMLFVIEEVQLEWGDRLAITPGVGPEEEVHIGDQLEIRRPDGTVGQSHIAGLNFTQEGVNRIWPITLPKGTRREDIPNGSEVWWVGPAA